MHLYTNCDSYEQGKQQRKQIRGYKFNGLALLYFVSEDVKKFTCSLLRCTKGDVFGCALLGRTLLFIVGSFCPRPEEKTWSKAKTEKFTFISNPLHNYRQFEEFSIRKIFSRWWYLAFEVDNMTNCCIFHSEISSTLKLIVCMRQT